MPQRIYSLTFGKDASAQRFRRRFYIEPHWFSYRRQHTFHLSTHVTAGMHNNIEARNKLMSVHYCVHAFVHRFICRYIWSIDRSIVRSITHSLSQSPIESDTRGLRIKQNRERVVTEDEVEQTNRVLTIAATILSTHPQNIEGSDYSPPQLHDEWTWNIVSYWPWYLSRCIVLDVRILLMSVRSA